MQLRPAVVGALVLAPIAACSLGETNYEEVTLPLRPSNDTVTCNSPFVNVDLGKAKPCGSKEKGKGHCYDVKKVPIVRDQAEPCDGDDQFCIPDAILTANGKKAKDCTFFYNKQPGVCVSMLNKGVYDNKDVLKRDGCAEEERCLPCIDPRSGKDTSLCAPTGAHEADCVGGTGEAPIPCCHRMGECVVASAVPEGVRSSMIRDTCKGDKLCAPIAQIDAKPVTCSVLGASGVCMDLCFAEQLHGTVALTRSKCGPTEVCLPCVLANAGAPSGQHLIGCD